ncbi:MAG TPA: hypothetical protein PL182_06490 [Pseudobdellovibrionaceae bacterium]|nr:hypothetical protein [Pseudobdellovibrionaceae bacterium]
MKALVFFATVAGLLLTGLNAVAQTNEVMSCTVQVEGQEPQVSVSVVVQSESSADFVMLNLVDKNETTVFFTQLEKGEVARNLSQGSFTGMVLQENFAIDAGVVRNAGIFTASFSNGAGQGLFAAKGNLYPLNCILK